MVIKVTLRQVRGNFIGVCFIFPNFRKTLSNKIHLQGYFSIKNNFIQVCLNLNNPQMNQSKKIGKNNCTRGLKIGIQVKIANGAANYFIFRNSEK